jgi:DNA topoisomerase I
MRRPSPKLPFKQPANADTRPHSLVFGEVGDLSLTRRRFGKGFAYFDDRGRRITDRAEIDRLNRVAVPPAYRNVRLNGDPQGHLQAIGTDSRGRRQYRYHPAYRATRDERKFAACADFGARLPAMRAKLKQQLSAPPTSYEAVIAAMILILDTVYLRIGNEGYARCNKSFGLSTLRTRHLRSLHGEIELRYRGKSGRVQTATLSDRALLRVVRQCQHLPGQRLFQYRSMSGEVRAAGSAEVNAFIRELLGGDYTAKDFRTWHASVLAFEILCQRGSQADAIAKVAEALGNTPAVARKSYIHPRLLEAGHPFPDRRTLPRASKYMSRFERGFLAWLGDRPVIRESEDNPD